MIGCYDWRSTDLTSALDPRQPFGWAFFRKDANFMGCGGFNRTSAGLGPVLQLPPDGIGVLEQRTRQVRNRGMARAWIR